jgi:hypothetical protein
MSREGDAVGSISCKGGEVAGSLGAPAKPANFKNILVHYSLLSRLIDTKSFKLGDISVKIIVLFF